MTRCLAAALLLLAISGCDHFFNRKFVPPEEGADLRNRKVLVIPFKEKGWYGESAIGNQMSMGLITHLQSECTSAKFLTGDDHQRAVEVVYEWLEGPIPWGQVGVDAGVDAIVMGDVQVFSFEQPRIVGMLSGRMTLLVKIWDVGAGEFTFVRQLSFSFPDDPEHGDIAPSFEQTRPEITRRLVLHASRAISKLFCGAVEDLY